MPALFTRLGQPGQNRFRWFGWATVIALVSVALLAPASPALSNDTPGNNGTVKIHEGPGETEPGEVRNEPHVCTFHLHFYFADPEQAGTWEIQEWSPGDKGTVVLSGTYDTHGDGEDRQPEEGVYTLPNGHYKLFWDGDLDTLKHDKMKVFWVDCPAATESAGAETEVPTQSAGAETETPTEVPTTVPTQQPSQSAGAETETPTEVPTTPPSEQPSQSVGAETESPTEVPTSVPTEEATPTFGQSVGAETSVPSFGQSVAAETNVPGATQPNTSTAPTSGPDNTGWRGLLIALAFLVGLLLVTNPRTARSERRR